MNIIDLGSDVHHMVDVDALPPNPVVIDAGASYGEFLQAWYRHFDPVGDSWFVCLEPAKHAREEFLLRASEMELKFLLLYSALHGDNSISEIEFTEYIGPKGKYHQWGNCMGWYRNRVPASVEVEKYMVPTITLQRLIWGYENSFIDYLKMDIEGAEEAVILQMKPKVAARIGQMSFELHRGGGFGRIEKRLRKLGFNYILRKGAEVYAGREMRK